MTIDWVIPCQRYEDTPGGPCIKGLLAKLRAPSKDLPKAITLPLAFRISGSHADSATLHISVTDPNDTVIAQTESPFTIPSGDVDFALGVIHVPLSMNTFGRYLIIASLKNGQHSTRVATWFYFYELTIH